MGTKKNLEIQLEKLSKVDYYKNYLEQYPTDSATAAYILNTAYNDGNIYGKSILDLGCGSGIFACGSLMMGAAHATGIDIDAYSISIAKKNCPDGEFRVMDVSDVSGKYDTCIMNPPFGSVRPHADRKFLYSALRSATYIYSVSNEKASEFVRDLYSREADIIREEHLRIMVKRIYAHHTKDYEFIPAVFFTVKSRIQA